MGPTQLGSLNFALKNVLDALFVFAYPRQIVLLYNCLEGSNEKKIDDIVTNLCYDRVFCKGFNIDYCNITREDYLTIKDYVKKILGEVAATK